MAKPTILLIDNDPDFLETRAELLKQEDYQVLEATNGATAHQLLQNTQIDLVILDIRLEDDDDERDTSGLTLAKELDRSIPKIMMTNYPTVDAVREALKPQLDGLPAAVEFVAKDEGVQALIRAVRRALGPDAAWLRQVREAVDGMDNELEEDHNNAQRQSRTNFWASFGVAVAGVVIIFVGIGLVFWSQLEIGIATTVAGLVTEAVSYLFFQRVDAANERMDRYHGERIGNQRFKMLLQACEGLDSDPKRERCRESVIMTAVGKWLSSSNTDQRPELVHRQADSEVGRDQ